MNEALKVLGAIAWVAGVLLFFADPIIGGVVLLVALALTVRSISQTRERRHQELLEAAKRREQ